MVGRDGSQFNSSFFFPQYVLGVLPLRNIDVIQFVVSISFRGFALLFVYKRLPFFSGYFLSETVLAEPCVDRLFDDSAHRSWEAVIHLSLPRWWLVVADHQQLALSLSTSERSPLSPLRLPVLSSLEAIDSGLAIVSLECCWLLKSFNRNEKWLAELGNKSFQQFLCVPNATHSGPNLICLKAQRTQACSESVQIAYSHMRFVHLLSSHWRQSLWPLMETRGDPESIRQKASMSINSINYAQTRMFVTGDVEYEIICSSIEFP